MELKIRKQGEIYIIDVSGDMDLYNTNQLKELFMKMLAKDIQSFIINLENVSYIDSSGVGTLINIFSTVKQKNLKFYLANVHGTTKKVLELTKLMGFFPIAATVEEALKSIQ